ncbi:MAG: hypothetical protein ACT4PO_02850, partial [Actinomycetota bacterium]
MTGPEFLVVTNIPSPYRMHELRVLGRHLEQRGIGLQVRFMATTERGRHWRYDPTDQGFPGRMAGGTTVYLGDRLPLHLTPGLVVQSLLVQSRWVLLGGAWYQPAVLAHLLAARARGRCLLLWNESVAAWNAATRRAVDFARRVAFSRADGFVV